MGELFNASPYLPVKIELPSVRDATIKAQIVRLKKSRGRYIARSTLNSVDHTKDKIAVVTIIVKTVHMGPKKVRL